MSQNTCERSGVRKDKLRVCYFDHITQKKMVIDSGQKKIWNFMEKLGTKDSAVLKLLSPMTLWCFKKYFQNWHWNFLVVSCCLSIRLRNYLSLSRNSQRFTSGNLLRRILWPVLTRLLAGRGSNNQRWRDITALNPGQFTSMERKEVCKRTSWDLLGKKRVLFPSHFPAPNSLKSAWFLPGVKL